MKKRILPQRPATGIIPGVGQTRVDLHHLLEDLRDAHAGALEETILTEIAASALDSGAAKIRLTPDPHTATLTVVDDGRGMQRQALRRSHNVAASTKSRGAGIGSAGVGIKLALLVSDEVVTETRRGAMHVATRWHLATRYRAPWKWIPPPGLTGPRGTAVRLTLANPLSPLLDAGYLEEALRAHFEPLLDPAFDDLLRRHYPQGIVFEVGGQPLAPASVSSRERVVVPIRLGRKRLPSAVAVLERHSVPLPEDRHGAAISTDGKVIRRGWDWLGLTPAAPFRITALVEAPDLAACLTLSKNDFIRSGPRGAVYLTFRKAIQEVVSRQLAAWGDTSDADARPRTVRLERDLERVLEDLAGDFPLLRALADHGAAGQKRLPLPGDGDERVPERPRLTRYGLLVQFESRPGDTELGRLADGTIWINEAHPAYVRAAASRSSGYHTALTVALALAPVAAAATDEHAFVTQFLAQWGGAGRARPQRRAR